MTKAKAKLGPRILVIDIELSPNIGYHWGAWDQNISTIQLIEPQRMICFAARWLGEKKTLYYSEYHDDHKTMVQAAFDLLTEADCLVHYNGRKFDRKHLNREFQKYKLGAPAPYAQVDLLQVARKEFAFYSNKLDYVAQYLGVGQKVDNGGFQLWIDCLNGDRKAWAMMKKYNIGDIQVTEDLYYELLPWIQPHPHVGLYSGEEDCCPNCGGNNVQSRGTAYTQVGAYPRFRCNDCGKWGRGKRKLDGVNVNVRGIS